MSHSCPKTLLETNGKILSSPEYEYRILDAELGKKGYDGVRINGGRDVMLLGSMAENIYGFSGTYARQKQASLAPILTGWKRWVELHSTLDNKNPRTTWI